LTSFGIEGPLIAAAIAITAASAGIFVANRRRRLLVPVCGAILVSVTLLGLVPELVRQSGAVLPLALMAAAYLLLTLLDRKGYPVCPSCSHGDAFAATLIVATGVHAFVDGWGMTAAQTDHAVPYAVGAAILFHKIPEGLALGGLLRSAFIPAPRAILLATVAELPTIAGGWLGLHAEPGPWTSHALAVAAGTFLFFGIHAIEGWRARANLHSTPRLP
jgi:zinc transporter ZupT